MDRDIYVKKLTVNDDKSIYEMLQRIGACENEFKNTANGLSYDQFKKWLIEQNDWSNGRNLPSGYVPQTIYWLYDRGVPIGIGKVRHQLNENSRMIGGNIGYAIDPLYRGRGYAKRFLHELLIKADEIGVREKLLSVERYNPASKRVIECNGGILIKETSERWYFSFD